MQDNYTRVQQARAFAIEAHGDQMYGRMPYSYHLDQVHSKLQELSHFGWDIPEDAYVVAYLHDVLEDTDVTFRDLTDTFGGIVSGFVRSLTKYPDLPYQEYLIRVKANTVSKIVKIADTMCNLQASIASVEPKRVKKYSEQLARLMGN